VQEGYQDEIRKLTGVTVVVEETAKDCPVCQGPTRVLKTAQRSGVTLQHGSFHTRETVRVCISGCEKQGSPVVQHSTALAELIPPKSAVGYDIMVQSGPICWASFMTSCATCSVRSMCAKTFAPSLEITDDVWERKWIKREKQSAIG
jgi:hypothetical protein